MTTFIYLSASLLVAVCLGLFMLVLTAGSLVLVAHSLIEQEKYYNALEEEMDKRFNAIMEKIDKDYEKIIKKM